MTESGKLHACMVSQTFYPFANGLSSYIMDLSKALMARGHKISAVHLKPPDFKVRETVKGIGVHRVPDKPDFNYVNFKKFRDAIFTCCFKNYERNLREPRNTRGYSEYTLFNRECAKKIGEIHKQKKISCLHFHDPQVFMAPEFLETDIRKVLTWHINFPSEIGPYWSEFFIENLERFDSIIFPGHSHIRDARKLGVPEKKLGLLRPFIDVSMFSPEADGRAFRKKWGINDDERLLVSVGRLDPVKGQGYLIQAMKSIVRSFPNTKLCFIGNGSMTDKIMGGNPKRRRELERMVERRNLGGHVIFAGNVPRRELPQAYAAADITVLPSLEEGFGLCVSESLACQTPVIASAVGGMLLQVDHEVNGFLVRPRSYSEIRDDVKYLLDNEELRGEMGVRGRKKVVKEFSSTRGAEDYEDIYGQR